AKPAERRKEATFQPGQLDLTKTESSAKPPPLPPTPPPLPPAAPPRPSAPQNTVLNLDPGNFQPLTDDQTKAQARGAGSLFGNPWFGRRDLIPPASDPRTLLIDRAMVGHGLLTPEELTEIHTVGEQMAALRADYANAAHDAEL